MNQMTAPPLTVSRDHDYSSDFHKLRSTLETSDGRSYVQFVGALKPRYGIVARDIGLGYVALAMTAGCVALLGGRPWIMVWVVAIGALAIGYAIAYLQLFMHEAAHFNLAGDRARNDLLANLLVCAIAGQEITRYRRVHFQHHRALGRPDDTEQTYASRLTWAFLLKALSGVRTLEVISRREKHLTSDTATREPGGFLSPWILATVAIHAAVIGLAIWMQWYALILAWVAGVGICFPFFGALRNLLEHRPTREQAQARAGAVTRIFGSDLFSRTFGGAGFNRHLLHHWEPQVSYTNLAQLEQFLSATPLIEILRERRTEYWRAFHDLWDTP
jgi:fatty acid desaturase